MALIMLEPGERFEHLHQEDSTTQLIEGEVRFEMGDFQQLIVGDILLTPADIPHAMENTGRSVAIVKCAHGPQPPPGM